MSFDPCFVLQYLVAFVFFNHPAGEERAGCYTLIVFLLSCDCQCSVSLSHSDMGWSAV